MMYLIVVTVVLTLLKVFQAAPLSPSGGIEGSRWFEQMASTINQPPKTPFQDVGVNQPFQPPPNTPNQETPKAGPSSPGGFQPTQNIGYQQKQPSLFDLLFGSMDSDLDFAPEPQGFQNQGQQTKGFDTGIQEGVGSQGGSGFKNAGFQQPQQPQSQGASAGFQQSNPAPGFPPESNPGFQGQQPPSNNQPQGGPEQSGIGSQPNSPFNNPMQSEMSFINNVLRNFFMW